MSAQSYDRLDTADAIISEWSAAEEESLIFTFRPQLNADGEAEGVTINGTFHDVESFASILDKWAEKDPAPLARMWKEGDFDALYSQMRSVDVHGIVSSLEDYI